jgi:hypothetical protein
LLEAEAGFHRLSLSGAGAQMVRGSFMTSFCRPP